MANEEQLAILRQGVEVWNAWHEKYLPRPIDLSKADLSMYDLGEASLSLGNLAGANLERVNIKSADLSGTDLTGANLIKARLSGADLSGADLTGAELYRANIQRANLTGANLTGASLIGANFTEANLQRVNLTNANLQKATFIKANFLWANLSRADFHDVILSATMFADTDLSDIIGLDNVYHRGPSRIDIDTLYKSRGKIPEAFLRGCGVPDSLIEYLPSLIGATQPIQFYSCFISYSTKDDDFAKRLHSRMQQEHLRVWFAPEELKGGHKLRDQIDDAIRVYDKLLLILSEASMQSDWVAHEIRRAYTREQRDGKRVLFPIRLCDFESLADWELHDGMGRDLALEVRHYYIPDFSHWKDHDAFEIAFTQLLKALRADEGTVIQ